MRLCLLCGAMSPPLPTLGVCRTLHYTPVMAGGRAYALKCSV